MLKSFVLFGVFLSGTGVFSANVTCDDELECESDTLSSDDILCRGYKSCYSGTLSCTDDCACGGLLACHGATISTEDEATCFGEYGCKYADITATSNIWCDGRYGCKFTTLEAGNNIYCDGEYACRLNTISDVNYLYVDGDGGAQNSDISGFNRIYARGYEALTSATIDTDGVTTARATFGGYDTTNGATFNCASGSTCYIYCTSNTGCEGLTVYCYGTCVIDCDDDYECPTETDMSLLASPEASKEDKKRLEAVEASFESQCQERKIEREKAKKEEMEKDLKMHKIQQKLNKDKKKKDSLINYFVNFNGSTRNSTDNIMNNVLIVGIVIGFIASSIIFAVYNYFIAKSKNKDSKYQSLV